MLDLAGLVLLALGLAKEFAHVDLIPVQFRFPGYGLAFLAIGIGTMVISLIFFIKGAAKKA